MVVALFAMMAGNAVAAAAAPLDLSNWMAALEPIVGNNTLLDLSVRDSADTGVCSIRKFLQRHIACRLCTLTKSTLLSERFRCKNSRSLSFSTSVVVPARSDSSWGRNVFGTSADDGFAATRH